MTRPLAGLLLLALAGCAAGPALDGPFESERFTLFTDVASVESRQRVLQLAHRIDARIRDAFGAGPRELGRCHLVLIERREDLDAFVGAEVKDAAFERCGLYLSRTTLTRGPFESWHGPAALVTWPDPDGGPSTLAHELVHHAVAQLLGPGTPRWLNEGLAQELDHVEARIEVTDRGYRADACLAALYLKKRTLTDEQLLEHVRVLLRGGWPDEQRSRIYSATLVRFGLETQGWRTLRDARGWAPDLDAFVGWLRSTWPPEAAHAKGSFVVALPRPER